MSVSRACAQCRSAKTRCDHATPICGRCRRRGLACYGSSSGSELVFLNENQVARRNSERARAEPSGSQNLSVTIDLGSPEPFEAEVTELPARALRQQLPWLSDQGIAEVPRALLEDVETRAVERVFTNWTLHPDNDGMFLGYMHDLPLLYSQAGPDSALRLAVRAMAFADISQSPAGNANFSREALGSYGAALSRLRALPVTQHHLADDDLLAALLLVDNFESMYLGRVEPLGPHSIAIKYLLKRRGPEQFYGKSRLGLWQIAYQRLQARQAMLREEPDYDELGWLGKLDMGRTLFQVFADVQRTNHLVASAKRISSNDNTDSHSPQNLAGAQQLQREIEHHLSLIESRFEGSEEDHRPNLVSPDSIARSGIFGDGPSPLLPEFKCPRVLEFHDIWEAYMWNFHAATQIIMRESLLDVFSYIGTFQPHGQDELQRIAAESDAVLRLSSIIIRSFPQLLGFMHKAERRPYFHPQGRLAGRFFALFSLHVVEKSPLTPPEHKRTAAEVIAWIKSSHRLHPGQLAS